MQKEIFMNRELSWLKFNERVLEEAENIKVPLCERLSFAAIYQSNLDEFFMVRVGSLIDQELLGKGERENKTQMTAQEQIRAILPRVQELNTRKDIVYTQIMHSLEKQGVRLVDFHKITQQESARLRAYFQAEIEPLLSPSVIGKRQTFPFLRNRELYAVAALENKSGKKRLGIIPCVNTGSGKIFSRLINVKGSDMYMLSEDLILHYMPRIFKGYQVKEKAIIRITRNADIDADALYDEDLDYRDFMEKLIKKRKKLAPLRLEIEGDLSGETVKALCGHLDLNSCYVYYAKSPLDLSFAYEIQDLLRKNTQLFFEKRVPQKSPMFSQGQPILDQIRKEDKLLSYPYESIKPFLQMLHEAANDPDVISIKMTLYRMARQSKVVEYLIEAAENGKEVFVLVELKARFDEENNIEWSRLLEDAGCRVIYGLDGYKVHSKLCLITKRSEDRIEYYTQVGTGNYNEKTSRLYTDLSFMTSNVQIGMEAARIFQALAMGQTPDELKHLLAAPNCLQNRVIEMIDGQIELAKSGQPSYIGLKMNSLTDKKIIDKLVEASQAGVKIDMIIRGICCLIPGVQGYTENISVRSIVGRFLEHSRIYIFGVKENAHVYIASADFMTRNTLRRVEVAAPIENEKLKKLLLDMFDVMLRDNQKARVELPDTTYAMASALELQNDPPLNAQEYFYDKAYDA
ncbi:MAG: polyphosphate kinase 1 [Clostridiales bacterium]|nr:polyphosphate kinase 1 [Clostridiales bacterium]